MTAPPTIPEAERGYIEELTAALEKARTPWVGTPAGWPATEKVTVQHFGQPVVISQKCATQLLADAKLGQLVREAGPEIRLLLPRLDRAIERETLNLPMKASDLTIGTMREASDLLRTMKDLVR